MFIFQPSDQSDWAPCPSAVRLPRKDSLTTGPPIRQAYESYGYPISTPRRLQLLLVVDIETGGESVANFMPEKRTEKHRAKLEITTRYNARRSGLGKYSTCANHRLGKREMNSLSHYIQRVSDTETSAGDEPAARDYTMCEHERVPRNGCWSLQKKTVRTSR